jgi:hypothetical protein
MVAGSVNTYTVTLQRRPAGARGVVLVDQVPLDKVIQESLKLHRACSRCCRPPWAVVPMVVAWTPKRRHGTRDVLVVRGIPEPLPPPAVLNNVVLCYVAGASSPALPAMMPSMPVSATVSLIIKVIPDLASAGKVNANSATAVLVGAPLTPEPAPTSDPNPANNQAIDVLTVGAADITIVKAGPASVLRGGAGSYTITLTDAGVSPASDVDLE